MTKIYVNVPTDEFFDNHLFRLNKIFLKAYGRWPYQSRKVRTSIVVIMWVAIISVVIPEAIFFREVIRDKNWNKVVDCLAALIATYGSFVIISNTIFRFDKITQTLDEMHNNWSNLEDQNEVAIFTEYAETGKILILVYLILATGTFSFFCSIPFLPFVLDIFIPLNESRPVTNLLQVQYYVDERKYYMPIYLHGLQAAISVVYTFIAFDSYFIMIVQHACGMFSVLGYKIESISRLNLQGSTLNSWQHGEQFISAKLSECVRFHWNCLRFINLIEDSLNIAWILQLSLNMVVISICGVQTITRSNEPLHMLQFFMDTVSIVFRLFDICWPGQKIVDHSNQFYDVLNNSPWYNYPMKTKKLLLLMMLRSSSPSYITAGKMVYLNFQTYCTLMQTSMSYLTMILSTQ